MSTISQPAVDGQSAASHVFAIPASGLRDFSKLEVSPVIQRALDAFRTALPELLKIKTQAQVWAAFDGDQLITFGRTKAEAYQVCLERGLERGTFIVRMVEPEVADEWESFHES